jgi:hypothetical protein
MDFVNQRKKRILKIDTASFVGEYEFVVIEYLGFLLCTYIGK